MPSPIVTTSLQAASLSSASNVFGQIARVYKHNTPFKLDIHEFLRFVVLSLLTSPINYKWQQALERWFPTHKVDVAPALPLARLNSTKRGGDSESDFSAKPRLSYRNTFLKWFIDCMTVGALFNTVLFLLLLGLLKFQPAGQIVRNIRTETLPIIISSYKIWPFASLVNFALIPAERRLVFLSSVGLLWGIYMSLVAASL